ncbi:NAD(P)H-hydrate dehydratase [Sandarakinorhabdus sp.]|uniref:NAD(P)H-hydrate dehydratase n=1 Tax=Sandarakinorhabdus sp. TaxID=1916663 RepID=UPI00286DFCC3|nr:NAD(P)H-hydrate dehydratase [Sandarakinorhabdus sp.]
MFIIDSGLPLVTSAAMRSAEAAAIAAGTPALTLMERAATGAARAILAFAPARRATVLCGPGNNGGDGYGIALALAEAGVAVTVAADAAPVAEPAATMAGRWTGKTVPLVEAPAAPLIVDALFGVGLSRPLPDSAQAALDRVRGQGRVVAIDIVSGLGADSGRALGRVLPAELTITFGAAKPGHILGEGAFVSGRLAVVDIGIAIDTPLAFTARPRLLGPVRDTHKYGRGWVMVVEGTPGHGGASGLAGLAALRTGAGLVTLAGEGGVMPALALMRRNDEEAAALLTDQRLGAVVIGPGMQADVRARGWLKRLSWAGKSLVIDAGALRLLPRGPIGAPAVLTPHEGEFEQLFGPVGDDRLGAVLAAARISDAVVVLKGAATIIAAPDGRAAINAHASPYLATAGSGDVLAGMIAALIAQGLPLFEAAQAAAWLHGEAGLRLGPGGIADDLVAGLPAVLKSL